MITRRFLSILALLGCLLAACTAAPDARVHYDPVSLRFSGEQALATEAEFVGRFPYRHSGAPNNQLAAEWLRDQFTSYGLDCAIDEWEIVPDKRMRNMSKGQKRLAELALCFSCHPGILVLDEPFVGLDAVMRFNVLSAMKEMNTQLGTTIFYSSHILSDIEKIAKRVVIIRDGEISLDQQIENLTMSVEEAFIQNYGVSVEDLM